MNTHQLYSEQQQLEDEMRGFGIERYRKQVRDAKEAGRETATAPVNRLMDHVIVATSQGIKEWKDGIKTAGPGRHHAAYPLVKDIDDDLLAYFTAKAVLDGISGQNPNLTQTASQIGHMINDEMHFRAFSEQAHWTYRRALEDANKTSNMAYRRRHLKEIANKKGVVFSGWTTEQIVRVGLKLLDIMVAKTGVVEVKLHYNHGRIDDTVYHVLAKPDTLAWIEEAHKKNEGLSPFYIPTIIPPRPWTTPFEGGYWFRGSGSNYALVKTFDKGYLKELAQHSMPEVYDAINVIQNTPWRINKRILAVLNEMDAGMRDYGIVPSADPLDRPAKPFWLTEGMTKDHMSEVQLAEFLRWKKRVKATHEANATRISKRIEFLRMLWLARKFAPYGRFYFPHQLDFRGRIYPVPMLLNPQGPDMARGLLEFADAKPLETYEAVGWLASHGAGCWGVDKVSFSDRRNWVFDNEEQILAAANDPLVNTFWTKAEKPLQALAFCFEWKGFKENGLAHRSHLPVQMDGTCNGLQHFSAMLRDPVGGRAVNLLPGDRPSDIYQSVADVVSERVRHDAVHGGENEARLAQGWAGHVTRKVTKRPVMTLAYGAKQFGFTDQVFYDTIIPWRDEQPDDFPFENCEHASARYMAAVIWQSVGHVVVAAKDAMSWLQATTSLLSKSAKPVEWVTPVGLLVRQQYRKSSRKRIDTTLFGKRFTASVDSGQPGTIDKKRQANGVSPNFVHSMDGAHLMKTVNAAFQKHGIRHFSLIHDSYGCHAADAATLADTLRDQFVRMYEEHDVLSEFLDHNRHLIVGGDIPDLPVTGELDLTEVRRSPYFFA